MILEILECMTKILCKNGGPGEHEETLAYYVYYFLIKELIPHSNKGIEGDRAIITY